MSNNLEERLRQLEILAADRMARVDSKIEALEEKVISIYKSITSVQKLVFSTFIALLITNIVNKFFFM